jgi:nitrite reductase/ring-hydroxylating ferredoxin subunit
MAAKALCRLEALADGGGRSFEVTDNGPGVLLLRDGEIVRGYVNSCPHRGTPLDLIPDRIRDASGRFIVCSTHGAQFRVEDGVCVFGPCIGARLPAVALSVRDGWVTLKPRTDETPE